MKRRNLIIKHVLIPLIIGGFLYILFRSTNLILFSWLKNFGLGNIILSVRNHTSFFKLYLPQSVYFSLPNALWLYSFSSALLICWNGKINLWLLIPFFSGILVEIGQSLKIFPGTFDFIDLTFACISLSLSIIIIKLKFKKNEAQIF